MAIHKLALLTLVFHDRRNTVARKRQTESHLHQFSEALAHSQH